MAQRKYGKWTCDNMQKALESVRNKEMGLNEATRAYGIPKGTLFRHLKNVNKVAKDNKKHFGRGTFLPNELERELVDHCLELERMFFGLCIDDLRRLAFEVAEKNGYAHIFNRQTRMAGRKWYRGFMRRHRQLSLREPEATSIARATGFNKPRVHSFFDLLETVYARENLTADRLYNMDETCLSTVQTNQKKIIGERGKRQIGAITSNERGQSTTCVVCVSSSGVYIPPMLIFRRKRVNQALEIGAPPGTVFLAQDKGWMTATGFCFWLGHFIKYVKPSVENKIVLILDGHVSHTKNLAALEMARSAGVVLVSLPPHTTHRLQPLDVGFFGPLSRYYDDAIRTWLRTYPGKAVSTYQVSTLLTASYGRAATVENATNAFRKSGLWPLDRHVFQDSDFAASQTTDNASDQTTLSITSVRTVFPPVPILIVDSAGPVISVATSLVGSFKRFLTQDQ